jgi:hypothetical protein
VHIPTQFKATKLVVALVRALAAWTMQRSDPDFINRVFSRLPLDNNDVAIAKKRKKTEKRKKRKAVFGESNVKERRLAFLLVWPTKARLCCS